MKKIVLLVIFSTAVLFVVVSLFVVVDFSRLKEKDFINTTYEMQYKDRDFTIYGMKYEFYKDNIGKMTAIKKDQTNGASWVITWKIEKNYLTVYYSDGELINKYEISNNGNTLTSISKDEIYERK